ncbi:MAG: isoprenylcysteine carboxylmethyltransferase family protein [Smithella sp.]|nr:isoprenylcysteine carboxylmethyltransferase family protein [Smithella sp.]
MLLLKTLNPRYIKEHPGRFILTGMLYMLGSLSGFLFLIFLFLDSFTIINLGLSTRGALLINAFLSIIFFIQHSIMVRKGFKRQLKKFMPEIYHNAFYAIVSIIVLLMVLVFWQPSHLVVVKAEGFSFWFLRGVFLLCLAGFFWAVKSLGSFDALGVNSLLDHKGGKSDGVQQITARGPYRWSRHPIYLLLIMIIWACPVLTLDRLVFNILWSVWIVIGAYLEDRDLHREFGDQYSEYSRRVPMLIPYKIFSSPNGRMKS